MTDAQVTHRKNFANQCIACAKPWPCDRAGQVVPPTYRLIAARDQAEAAADREHREHLADVDRLADQRDAARALADELAEALRRCLWQLALAAKDTKSRGWRQAHQECLDECKPALAKWEASRAE